LGFESEEFELFEYSDHDGYQKHNENIELIDSLIYADENDKVEQA
jgi:hypothetical protein